MMLKCKVVLALVVIGTLGSGTVSFGENGYSQLVYPGLSGFLIYRSTEIGDRVPNFSMVGYGGGGVPIPDAMAFLSANRIVSVAPGPGDDYRRIQDAIDQVSTMRLNELGLRGVVQLQAGDYQIDDNRTLSIRASGVVLRGSGAGETVLTATGTGQKTLLNVSGSYSSSTVPWTTARGHR
ncbi:MAG: hypothetical protein ACYST5_07610 [Planctomycetota bacterium]